MDTTDLRLFAQEDGFLVLPLGGRRLWPARRPGPASTTGMAASSSDTTVAVLQDDMGTGCPAMRAHQWLHRAH